MKEYIYKKLHNTIFCHGLPLEELVCHGRVLHREEGGEEEEAQEGEVDDLCPASQPGSASQWSDETRRLATGRWARPRAGLHIHRLGQRQQRRLELGADQLGAGGLLLAVLHQQAEHSEECRCVRGEQRDQLSSRPGPSHRLLADGLSHQHGCRQVRDDKDRHNYGHVMTPGGPPV